ncbi:MAG TPA: hypothetical protein VJ964_15565 [Balneolaceae bacterium]|nr:hypothetical protein [Balneolaceae bacterium]
MTYKIIFNSGVKEEIIAKSIEINDVLNKVEIKDTDDKVKGDYYFNFEHISAIIPQKGN